MYAACPGSPAVPSRAGRETTGLARSRADPAAWVTAHLAAGPRVHAARPADRLVNRFARLLRTRLADAHARAATPVAADLRNVAGIGSTRDANGNARRAAQHVAQLARPSADTALPIAAYFAFRTDGPSTTLRWRRFARRRFGPRARCGRGNARRRGYAGVERRLLGSRFGRALLVAQRRVGRPRAR